MRCFAQRAGRGERQSDVRVVFSVTGSVTEKTEIFLHQRAVHVVRRGGREELDPAGARRHHAELV